MIIRRPQFEWTGLLLALLVLLLSACSSKQTIDEDPTIQMLAERAAKIEPLALPPLSRADVQRTYEQLAKTTNNAALRAIALQRLADLALEDRQAELAGEDLEEAEPTRAVSAEQQQADAAKQEAGLSKELNEELIAEAEQDLEQKSAGSAIHQYERLLTLYPDYEGNNRVMYQLARAYELNGDLDKTLGVLTGLVKKFPNEKNFDELQFRRGEILFTFREFEKAEKAYDSVLALGAASAYHGRAMFKRGWSVFKQGDTQRSLESYFAVLDSSFANGRKLSDFSRSELELLEDTLRIVSLSFSYLKGHESVTAFFKDYGHRDYEYSIYERLADLYLTQERAGDASETFMAFVEAYPQHRNSPLFTVRVIDIYKQAGRKDELLRAKADLVMAYGVGTEYWKNHDQALLTQLLPHLKSNLNDLTAYYHAQAQDSKKTADYRIAALWYRTFVRSFPNDKDTAAKNMLLAESLLDSGDVQGAAVEFEYTAYHYPPHAQSAEAAYAALLAHRSQAESLKGAAAKAKREIAIASGKRFVTNFPADKRAVNVMSKAAEELLALKDYRNAVGTAHYVVGHKRVLNAVQGTEKLARINWAIISQAEFELGHYPQAEAATLKRLQFSGANDKDKKDYMERLAAAIYKQGEQEKAAGNYRAAARHFLRVGKLTPSASIRVNADFDAAGALYANQDWAMAIPVLKAFVLTYPSHKLRSEADKNLALAYEKSGDWKRAADSYEVLYRSETNSNKKRLLLWQIAEFYEKAKRQDAAVEVYKRYVTAFPRPFDEAMEARHRLATIYLNKKQILARNYWLGKIIEADKEGPATDRSRYLAASASLELAGPTYVVFKKVRLVQPLKQNLKKKKKLMQESIKAFTDAANYGIEAVTTASTYNIAEIYSEFGKGLFDSERPKGLSPDELEQYDILLEEQAYPFEEKAIDVHVVNAARAITGVYDKWVRKSFSALSKLDPIRYAKSEKMEQVTHELE
jgi:outer membrane protein assembly factor BamD (BamD/ComL family)